MLRRIRDAMMAIWRVGAITLQRFGDMRAGESAAGMSYYALFSLFPMLLFFIVAATFVLEDEAAYQFVLDLAVTALPVSPQVVTDNLQEVLALRGTIGLIAGLGFLWSASGFFGILSHQVNIIRPRAVARTGVHVRLIGLGIVAGLAILLILWLFISPLLRMVLDRLLPRIEGQVDYTRQAVNILSYWIFPLGISYLLYRYAPRGRAHKREAITGAIGGALCAAAGADFLCYVTPAEHLGLPTDQDVWDGVIASRIAAHSADLVKGVPAARDWDDRMSRARADLDWTNMHHLAIDPGRVSTVRGEEATLDPEACSMCGRFCSMKVKLTDRQ